MALEGVEAVRGSPEGRKRSDAASLGSGSQGLGGANLHQIKRIKLAGTLSLVPWA